MNQNFLKAVEFAKNELQAFYDRGGSFSALNQKGRSEILGIFSEDFDWRSNLKRYCAHLIRAEKQIPGDLVHWIADVLEGIQPALKQPRGGVATGLENNFLIPRLVEKVAVFFKLDRTRNETSDPMSACDAVQQAIILVPEASDIKSRQYRSIKQAYTDAKNLGIFVDN
jgi:hypothetical protein